MQEPRAPTVCTSNPPSRRRQRPWEPLGPVSIEAHRRFTLADLKPRERSRMPNDRHPLRTSESLTGTRTEIPRIPLNRRRQRDNLRIRAQRQLRSLTKRN